MRLFLFLISACSFVIASCNNSKSREEKTEEKNISISGRTDDEKVKDILNRYKEYAIREDLEGMISMMSPGLLEKTTPDQLFNELKEGLHNESYDIIIRDVHYDSISKIIEKNGNKYSKAHTRTNASFRLKSDEQYEKFCSDFKIEYAEVVCDVNERTVSFEMKDEIYVVYDNKLEKWFIISSTDPDNVEKSIPADIRKELRIIVHRDDE